MLRRAAEGFWLLSAATLVSTAFLCDSQWHPDILDIWSYGCMCTLCCLGAVELMWLCVCIKFGIIRRVIRPISILPKASSEKCSSYTCHEEKTWVQIKCIFSGCHRTRAFRLFLNSFIDDKILGTGFALYLLSCNTPVHLWPLSATII